jgi:hypothetical protein
VMASIRSRYWLLRLRLRRQSAFLTVDPNSNDPAGLGRTHKASHTVAAVGLPRSRLESRAASPTLWCEIGMDVNWEPTLLRLRPLDNGMSAEAFRYGEYVLEATIHGDESTDEVRSAQRLASTIEDIRDRVLTPTIVTVSRLDSPDALVEQEAVSALSARLEPHGGIVKPPPVRGPLQIEF